MEQYLRLVRKVNVTIIHPDQEKTIISDIVGLFQEYLAATKAHEKNRLNTLSE